MFKLIDGTELTEEIKDAFKKKVTKAYIKLKNGTILSGENFLKSLEIEDLRYNEETNNFLGEAVAKRATVDLYNKENAINVEDEEFEAFIGAELSDGTTAWISYGNFIVQKPENDDTKEDTVIEAFDYMCKFNKTYTPGVTFPCTYADIVEDICEQCGVELANRDFRNAEKVVKENFFINGEQCRTVLKQVAKIAFSWARVGNDNKLYIDFKNKDIEEAFENFDLDSYIDLNKNNQLIPVDTIVLRNSAIESENVTIKFDKDAKINKFIGDMEQDTIEAVAGTTVENNSVHVTDVDLDFETEVLPMGNIEQDTIAEVAGTTVEGSSINATGVDLNYDTKVLPMGTIEQETSTQGKNLIDLTKLIHNDISTIEVLELTPNKLSIKIKAGITAWTNISFFLNDLLENGATYTFSLKAGSDSNALPNGKYGTIGFNRIHLDGTATDANDKNEFVLDNTTTTYNRTIKWTIDKENFNYRLYFFPSQSQTITEDLILTYENIYIAKESSFSGYAEFVPDMPSLNYPSEVKGVGSEKHINLVDLDISEWEQGLISASDGQSNDDPSYYNIRVRTKNFHKMDCVEHNFSFENMGDIRLGTIHYYDSSKKWIDSQNNIDKLSPYTQLTFTPPQNTAYFRFTMLKADKTSEITPSNVINSKPKLIANYCRYNNVVENKNIFKPTLVNNGTNIVRANGTVTLVDDEYSLTATGTDLYFGNVATKGVAYTENRGTLYNVKGKTKLYFLITNSIFNKNYITAYDSNKISLGFSSTKPSSGSYDIPANAEYISFRFGYGTATVGETYRTKVMLSFEQITEYVKHQEQTLPIDIPIGQEWYSGKPYKVGSKWYRKVEWGKEKITIISKHSSIFTETKGFFQFKLTNKDKAASNGAIDTIYCTHLKARSGHAQGSFNNNYDGIWWEGGTDYCYAILPFTSKDEAKAWADNLNLMAIYKLATPIVEEIIDTHLIEQLEALQNAEFYDGVTNINTYATVDEVADMPLSVKYNFITPSPSLDIPSAVKGVGSEKHINLARIEKEGYYRQYGTGNFAVNASYNSQIASVEPNKTYTIKKTTGDHSNIAFFGKDMTYISGIANATTITTPDNCYFVTVAVHKNTNDFMFYEGTDDLPYTPYGYCRYETAVRNINLVDDVGIIKTGTHGGLTVATENGKIIVNGTPTSNYPVISQEVDITDLLEDGETYTLIRFGEKGIYNQCSITNTNGTSTYVHTASVKSAKFTFNKAKMKKVSYAIQSGAIASTGTLTNHECNFMLVKGDYINTNVNYMAHQEQSFLIDIPIEQYNFTKNYETTLEDANIDANSRVSSATDFDLVFFKVPKGNYHITLKSGKTATWVTSSWASIPAIGTVINTRVVTNSATEFNYEMAQDGYLILRYGLSLNWNSIEEFINDLMITDARNISPIWYSGKPYKVGSKWYRDVEWKKKVFNGAENWTYYEPTKVFFDYDIVSDSKKVNTYPYCNYLKGGGYGNKSGTIMINNAQRVHISLWDFTTVAELKSWLQELYANGTPLYMVYELAEPYPEEITDAHLIEQLEAIKAAELYEGVTNVNSYKTSDDVAEMPLSVRYNFVTPAPSTDRESPIKSVTGACNLYNVNGNLFDVDDLEQKGADATKNSDDSITITYDNTEGTAVRYVNYYTHKTNRLKPNTNYYVVVEILDVSGTGTLNYISQLTQTSQITKSQYAAFASLKRGEIKVTQITTTDDFTSAKWMLRTFCSFNAGQSGSITFRLSVFEQEQDLEKFVYKKFNSQQFPLDLGSLELFGDDKFQDYIYNNNGKWYKHSEFYNQRLTKVRSNEAIADTTKRRILLNATKKPLTCDTLNNKAYSNRYKIIGNGATWQSIEGFTINTISGDIIYIYDENFSSLNGYANANEFNLAYEEYLANNEIYIVYPLAEPYDEEITDTTLLSQLNAIKDEFFLVEGENHIMFSCDNGTQPQLEIKHYPNKYSLKETISTGNDLTLNASYEHRELVVKEDYFAYNEETRRDLIESARELFGLTYLPVDLSGIGTAYLENNDLVTVTDKMGNVRPTYCLNHILKYNGVLYDTIAAPAMTETETKYQNESQEDLSRRRTEVIVNKATQEIQLVSEKVDTYDSRISEVEVGLDGIISKIESDIDITRTINGLKTLTLEECLEGDLLELHIYGNNQVFKRITPSGTTYPSDELIVKDDSLIKITRKEIDEEGNYIGETSEIIDLKIKEVLRQLGDVADSFDLVNNKATLTRRIGVNTDNSLYVLTNPIVEDLGDLEIPLVRGTNIIEIVNYSAMMSAKYVIINAFTNTFATTVDLKSAIEILYNQINLEVSKKVNDDEIIARINMAILGRDEVEIPDDINKSIIEILANKISIKSDNFELTKDGTVTAKEGNIAGLRMTRDANGNSYLSKNYTDANNNVFQSGLYIPNESSGTVPFLYAGCPTDGYLTHSNLYIRHDGLIRAKWFDVNGESGYFSINFDSGRQAVALNKESIVWRIDDEKNENFFELSNRGTVTVASMYASRDLIIDDPVHNNSLIILSKFSPETGATAGSSLGIYCNVGISGFREGTGEECKLYVQGYEILKTASDERIKDNIVDSEIEALKVINQIHHKSFDWNKEKAHKEGHIDIGYIAQELIEIDPNFVVHDKEYDTYQINTLYVLSTATKAIQELSAENNKLKETVDKQQKIIDFLINKLDCKDEISEILKEGE